MIGRQNKMKKSIALLMALVCTLALALAGCKAVEQDSNTQAPQVINPEVIKIIEEKAEEKKVIVVSGSGSATLTPDMATAYIRVTTSDADPAKAQADNSELMSNVLEAIKAAGVKEEDITTENVSLNERYDYDKSPAVVVGYEMENVVKVTIRSIDDVGKVLGDAIAAGATGTYGLSLSVSDSSGAYQAALKAAIEDATGKADAMAEALGVAIDRVPASVNETSSSYTPNKAYDNIAPMATSEPSTEAAAEVAVNAGDLTVNARVSITFRIAEAQG